MKNGQPTPVDRLLRYADVFTSQAMINREYLYFWLFATLLDIAVLAKFHPIYWLLIAVINLLIGILAIGSLIRPVDKAFETIGLDFGKGYGQPQWIVRGKYPLKQEAIRVRAAGYAEEDFQRHISQISSRLNQPIMGLRKVSPTVPEIEVLLKRTLLPDIVKFEEFDLGNLASGEFIIGKSSTGTEKVALSRMTHMLVAGQTGSGKTQFLRQFITTVLTQTRGSYVSLIDMKGGIDFQYFKDVPNFEMVTTYEDAEYLLDKIIEIYEERKEYILLKRKTNWNEFPLGQLEKEERLAGKPLGPIVVVVDELAELSKKATAKASKSELQEKLATLARLSRFTGIHLVLGTQRPDKSTIDMQSKDNLPTRVCFAVPSVAASNLVLGDMSASTIGHHPGRGVYQLAGSKIIQAPIINNTKIEELVTAHSEKLKQQGFDRGISNFNRQSKKKKMEVPIK